MDLAYADQVGAVGFVEAVQIGGVLEVVGVNVAVCCSYVRLYIVVKLDDFESPALFCKLILNGIEDLSVRCRRSCYLDRLVCAVVSAGSAAACREDPKRKYEYCCKDSESFDVLHK